MPWVFPAGGDNHCLYPYQLGESEKSSGFSVPSPSRGSCLVAADNGYRRSESVFKSDAFADCSAVLNVIQSYRRVDSLFFLAVCIRPSPNVSLRGWVSRSGHPFESYYISPDWIYPAGLSSF